MREKKRDEKTDYLINTNSPSLKYCSSGTRAVSIATGGSNNYRLSNNLTDDTKRVERGRRRDEMKEEGERGIRL